MYQTLLRRRLNVSAEQTAGLLVTLVKGSRVRYGKMSPRAIL